jgi:hypothetical protein
MLDRLQAVFTVLALVPRSLPRTNFSAESSSSPEVRSMHVARGAAGTLAATPFSTARLFPGRSMCWDMSMVRPERKVNVAQVQDMPRGEALLRSREANHCAAAICCTWAPANSFVHVANLGGAPTRD